MGMAEADRIRLVVPKETARNSENVKHTHVGAEADRIWLVVPKEAARNSENINVHEWAWQRLTESGSGALCVIWSYPKIARRV